MSYVYRCYDADGVLLYVGCAFNPHQRIRNHLRANKPLASHALQVLMDRYEVEGPYPTRAAADEAERVAIGSERPLLNRQHMGGNAGLDYALSLYLADHDISIESVGLHRCTSCDALRGHHIPRGMCQDCREAEAEGRLTEWVRFVAELYAKHGIKRAA